MRKSHGPSSAAIAPRARHSGSDVAMASMVSSQRLSGGALSGWCASASAQSLAVLRSSGARHVVAARTAARSSCGACASTGRSDALAAGTASTSCSTLS